MRQRRAVAALMTGVVLANLDTAIANTALPAIAADLHATAAASVWVVNAYQLAMVAALLPFAAWGDIVGHRRIYIGGLVVFTLASMACAMCGTLPALAVARAVQGVGAAGMIGVNTSLLRFIYPSHRLGRGSGLNSLMVSLGLVLGPSVASLVLGVASWPWLFGLNVPLGLIALAVAIPSLPASPRSTHRFDPVAAGLNAVTFAALILALGSAAQREPVELWLSLGVAALVFGTLLVRRERGHAAPILPVDLLRRPAFSLVVATSVCSFAAQGLAFVALPFLFEAVLHRNQVDTGFLMSPWPLLTAVAALVAGRLADRHSPALLGAIGLAVLGVGMASLALLPAAPSVPDLAIRMAVCGAGFGFFQSPNLKAMMSAAPPQRAGGASGSIGTSRLLGQAIGAALTASCFRIAGGARGAADALWLGAAFGLVASGVCWLRVVRERAGAAVGERPA
jgi:DHA2 family multidrug resistance protein-like MFS transporter